MDFIIYAVSFSLIWLLSWLPLRILYVFSDICTFSLWNLIPYRKKLVIKNLTLSFPEKRPEEIRKIAKCFYRHFCDTFMEAIVVIHMNQEEHKRRYRYLNTELLNKLHASGKDILLISSHYGNWEWLSSLPCFTDYRIIAIYKSLHNRYFDRMFIDLRSRYGVIPVTKDKTLKTILDYQENKTPVMAYFLADQRPSKRETQYCINFMNQVTPVIMGPEKIARKLDMAVVFNYNRKVRRGYYESVFVPLELKPGGSQSHEITDKYYRLLEKVIRESPAEYLWTHDRWKHTGRKHKHQQFTVNPDT